MSKVVKFPTKSSKAITYEDLVGNVRILYVSIVKEIALIQEYQYLSKHQSFKVSPDKITMVLCQILYWYSVKNRNWFYKSIEEFCMEFPFWSRRTIERILNFLTKSKIVLTRKYKRNKKIKEYKLNEDHFLVQKLLEIADLNKYLKYDYTDFVNKLLTIKIK